MTKRFGCTSAHLKWMAMIAMLIDHIGMFLFPDVLFLRSIGRLAFPIYAYLIGEGCKYTKNKWKYLRNIWITLTVFQIIYLIANQEFRLSVLGGFSLFVLFSILIDWAKEKWNNRSPIVAMVGITIPMFLLLIEGEYLFFPFVLPFISYVINKKPFKYALYALALLVLGFMFKNQMWCICSMIPILLYNGEKGRPQNKYLFYTFYPVHYLILYIISIII